MIQSPASKTDPRPSAIEQGRQVLTKSGIPGSPPSLGTVVLRRKDGAAPTAFLISLWSEPVRLLAPLRVGENIVARQSDIGDFEVVLPDTLPTIPKYAWPVHWCEVGQCHIVCQPPDRARVADRASYGTWLYRAGAPPELLPAATVQGSAVRYYVQGTGLEPVKGDWSRAAYEGNAPRRGPWSQLFEGDVVVCLHALWVFAWLPISSSSAGTGS